MTHSVSFDLSIRNIIIAVVRSTNIDFPYQSWSITPIEDSFGSISNRTCVFEIETKFHKIIISFYGNKCKLIAPTGTYEMDSIFLEAMTDLLNIEMRPGLLLHVLKRRGLNLIVNDFDIVFHYIRAKVSSVVVYI